MTHNERKILKIVQEITMFLFSVGGKDIITNINMTDEGAKIIIKGNYDIAMEKKFQAVDKLLSSPRDEALEDQFWELAGSGDMWESTQVLLVGVMTDEVTIEYNNGQALITLYRKNLQ